MADASLLCECERSEKSWSREGRTRSKVLTNSRWIHELWIILFVRWARSTLVHVVICTRHGHLPNSLDSEDGNREFARNEDYERRLWNWKRAKIVRLLKRSSVLHRRFPRQGGTREFVGGFLFFLFVLGLFMFARTRFAEFWLTSA